MTKIIHIARPPSVLRRLAPVALTFGAMCWIALWAGINTGPENLDLDYIASGWTGAFNGIRAAIPLAMIGAWMFRRLLIEGTRRRAASAPEGMWLWYGAVCLLSSLFVSPWFGVGYWGLAYIGAFAALDIYLCEGFALERARDLNRLSWIMCSAVLAVVVFVARGQLLASTMEGVSGYGVLSRVPSVAGMPMVRATGISRMAAVPAIVAFVAIWNARGRSRLACAAVFLPCFYLVWVMQSRGSLVSLAVALAMVMILLAGRARIVGWSILAIAAMIFVAGYVPSGTIHSLYDFATRGGGENLASMSGRTGIFHRAWKIILDSPSIGYGPQADRRLLGTIINNAQSGVLYALLCGGFIGAAGYVGGLLIAWIMIFRVIASRRMMRAGERMMLLQVVAIMAFFTTRSYPENCAALYGVDLLIQLPAIVYIGELERALRRAKQTRRVQVPAPGWRMETAPVRVGS